MKTTNHRNANNNTQLARNQQEIRRVTVQLENGVDHITEVVKMAKKLEKELDDRYGTNGMEGLGKTFT